MKVALLIVVVVALFALALARIADKPSPKPGD